MSTAASRFRHDFVSKNLMSRYCRAQGSAPAGSRSLFWKTILDRAVALLLLIPGLPLIGLLVLLVRLTSRGPGLYRQVRVGKGSRQFLMYKLRSMRIDAEERTGPVWSAAGTDSRVTPLGYWLRRLHLDELPQLFNVLKGEMSLVGPRPERPEFVAVLTEEIPGYLDRLQVLPGITGLAQVNLPPDSDLDSVRRKLVLDREYITNASIWLDQRIVLCTLLRLFGLRGGRSVRLFDLERTVVIPPKVSASCGDVCEVPATPHIDAAAARGGIVEPTQVQRCADAATC
jgi:lipopolysaccharide/colanic/teichoic acid biosynthesis glycosyltransferase